MLNIVLALSPVLHLVLANLNSHVETLTLINIYKFAVLEK
jgi:hypothetical protein